LLQVGPENGWQPLEHLAAALAAHRATAIGVVVESSQAHPAPGSVALPGSAPAAAATALATPAVQAALERAVAERQAGWLAGESWKLFAVPLALPPRVLLLGAGPDAVPVVEFAARLDWKVTLVDHRAAYAVAAHFPAAERVVLARPAELPATIALDGFSAAVVMSHHLPSDLAYLRALAATSIPYVGLLGPAARREKLISDLGPEARALAGRLHAPVGLPLGGRSPESIALAIVAQLHAFVHGADARAEAAPAVSPTAPSAASR
jgi:xanthine/CO dehydrogenase XdhC/CoxF family maturation factor